MSMPRLGMSASFHSIISGIDEYSSVRMFFANFGFYYPIYYLQLMAIKHNLSSSFSFYSVRRQNLFHTQRQN